jgi:hypothetical protein
MEHSPQHLAVRVYGGKLSINTLDTPSGKVYHLLNLPYYLTGHIEKYLAWFGAEFGV